MDEARIDRLVRLKNGVIFPGGVRLHLAGVGIHRDLHRVPHVVRGSPADANKLAVGDSVGGGVSVEHPYDSTAEHDDVRILVEAEEGIKAGGPIDHAAMEKQSATRNQ